MKLKILVRNADDWHELYLNEVLVYEGIEEVNNMLLSFILALPEFEYREIFIPINKENPYATSLHCFTDRSHWDDWESANLVQKRTQR